MVDLYWDGSDTSKAFHWEAVRMSSGIAVIMGYMIHWIILLYAHMVEPKIQKFDNHLCMETLKCIEKKMYLFGLCGLLTFASFIGNTWCAIFAYFSLISLIALHATIVPWFRREEKQNLKSLIFIVHYTFLFLWMTGGITTYWHRQA
ncbi:hypothetical protein PPERSA_10651 [Pseudocohnilembus persalinus]|uniref:Uncharacterized protein n=1 Tax=Pseudocohnilembus persalinus TaxID=266149 RepID=A0A0V0QDD4_PSEPJ|nr:hypothetical protein PPERSA_10651 [Pseudocohnilembus persalinus]|eukprot:KRX00152.1 hypothetical protein PPERSA_10651 [Pseudocohnilembus persalinus]